MSIVTKEIKAPDNISSRHFGWKSVFLAGSIEMGQAENWQTGLASLFLKLGYNVFNPRRDDWDSSWTQKSEHPQFNQQVNWELNALDKADLIVMYFDPNTKSPISLLELGLYATSGKIHVICPEDFWRKGNVDIVCNKYNIPLFESLEAYKQSWV
jgi:hypothetical protein